MCPGAVRGVGFILIYALCTLICEITFIEDCTFGIAEYAKMLLLCAI